MKTFFVTIAVLLVGWLIFGRRGSDAAVLQAAEQEFAKERLNKVKQNNNGEEII